MVILNGHKSRLLQFYQELLYIQNTEMATPSHGSYLTPAGQVMPAYSGRGRPPLNPQYNSMVNSHRSHYPSWFSD